MSGISPSDRTAPLQFPGDGVDIARVKLRASTTDRIEKAFAQAIEAGDFEAAQGWLTTARYVAEREDLRRKPSRARVHAER